MNIDTLTIGEAKKIVAMFGPSQSAPTPIPGHGRAVIVRSRDAGVMYGQLDRYEGSTVYLTEARQMWSWTAAQGGTLADCAAHGIKAGKISAPAPAVTMIGVCAILDCTPEAVKTLEAGKWA